MTTRELEEAYRELYTDTLVPLAESLEKHLIETLGSLQRIDRVTVRAKAVDRFMAKSARVEDGAPKYSDPLHQIQDQIGARIVLFYRQDVERAREEVEQYFRPIELQAIVPDTVNEFGYFGQHFILFIPNDVRPSYPSAPKLFELQLKTLFQHAWSEANHDLAYKPQSELSWIQKRRVAYSAAQAWGADETFDKLAEELEV